MDKVVIRKPCYEDLEDMPRVPGGVWCTKCGEKVEDVSNMNDEELRKWIGDNSKHKPCGIYRDEQAAIPLKEKVLMPVRLIAASVSALFMQNGIHAQATAAEAAHIAVDDHTAQDSSVFEFTGSVVSRNGNALADVAVYISDGDSVVVVLHTKDDGTFQGFIPKREGIYYTVSFYKNRYHHETYERYVPCKDGFVVKMKKQVRIKKPFHRFRHRKVVSKF